MVKYKLKKDQWKELAKWFNPSLMEDIALMHIRKMNLKEASHGLLLMEIGLKIVKALMRNSKSEITISFSYTETWAAVDFLLHMQEKYPKAFYMHSIAETMNTKINQELIDYKAQYQ